MALGLTYDCIPSTVACKCSRESSGVNMHVAVYPSPGEGRSVVGDTNQSSASQLLSDDLVLMQE